MEETPNTLDMTFPEGSTSVATDPPAAPEQRGKGPDRRNSVVDRRSGLDRRVLTAEASGYTGPERRVNETRAAPTPIWNVAAGRDDGSDDRKAAEEGEMTTDQFEFVMAIETYKKVNKKMFPTWTEVLEVITQLGYRKVVRRNVNLADVPEPELYRLSA